jgi:hypothetical protein
LHLLPYQYSAKFCLVYYCRAFFCPSNQLEKQK